MMAASAVVSYEAAQAAEVKGVCSTRTIVYNARQSQQSRSLALLQPCCLRTPSQIYQEAVSQGRTCTGQVCRAGCSMLNPSSNLPSVEVNLIEFSVCRGGESAASPDIFSLTRRSIIPHLSYFWTLFVGPSRVEGKGDNPAEQPLLFCGCCVLLKRRRKLPGNNCGRYSTSTSPLVGSSMPLRFHSCDSIGETFS